MKAKTSKHSRCNMPVSRMQHVMILVSLCLLPLLVCPATQDIFIWQEALIFLFGFLAACRIVWQCLRGRYIVTLFSFLAPILLAGYYLFHHLPFSMKLPRVMALLCLYLLWRGLDIRLARYVLPLACSLILLNAYLILQHLGVDVLTWASYGLRNAATFGNPNLYAAYINCLFFLLLVASRQQRKQWQRGVIFLALGVCLFSYAITASRSGLLVLCVGLALLVVKLWKSGQVRRLWPLPLLALLCILVVGLMFPLTLQNLANRVLSVADDPGARARLCLYGAAGNIFLAHPVVGVGINGFAHAFMLSKPDKVNALAPLDQGHIHVAHCHNEWLQILAEGGLLYFLLFAGLVVLAVRGFLQRDSNEPLLHGVWLGYLCLIVQALFTMPGRVPALVVVFFLWSALLAGPRWAIRLKQRGFRYLQALALVVCIALCAHGTVIFLHTQYGLYISKKRQAAGDLAGARDILRRVTHWDRYSIAAYSRLGILEYRDNPLVATDFLKKAHAAAPWLPMPWFNYMNALQGQGDVSGALAQAEALLQHYPRFLPAMLMRGVMLERLGRTGKAAGVFAAILQCNCFHLDALRHYISLARVSGQNAAYYGLRHWLRTLTEPYTKRKAPAGTALRKIERPNRQTGSHTIQAIVRTLRGITLLHGTTVPYMEYPSRRYVMWVGRVFAFSLSHSGQARITIQAFVPFGKVRRLGGSPWTSLRITVFVNGKPVKTHTIRRERLQLVIEPATRDTNMANTTTIRLETNFAFRHPDTNCEVAYCLTNLRVE